MISEILHKVAGQWQEEDHEYYPRPSLAGPQRCERQMVYWGLRAQKEALPGRTLFVFDDGNWHQLLTAEWIRKSAWRIHSEEMGVEISLPSYPSMKGSIDGVLTDIMDTDYLYEHKGVSHFSWQAYHDDTIPYDYVAQCCLYLRGVHEVNPNINRAILLVKNKNTAAYLEFIIHYDYDKDIITVEKTIDSNNKVREINEVIPDMAKSCFEKFKRVEDHIKARTLPKRQYYVDDWQCEYCGYFGHCWQDYRKEFNELKTAEMLSNEVADLLRYYKEVGAHKSEITKEYEELSDKIKATMKEVGVREGIAGEYIAKLTLVESTRLDKELLTAAEIERASKKSFYERLSISKPKMAKGENAHAIS